MYNLRTHRCICNPISIVERTWQDFNLRCHSPFGDFLYGVGVGFEVLGVSLAYDTEVSDCFCFEKGLNECICRTHAFNSLIFKVLQC